MNGPNNIILCGARVLPPASLRRRAIDIELLMIKALMQEMVWFPDIGKLTKDTHHFSIPCQAIGQPALLQPVQMLEMPTGP